MKEKRLSFIEENKMKYFEFITNLPGFPFVCDYSSDILMAYLSENYDIDAVTVVGDMFGDENKSHHWINIDGTIIDFTLCQFPLHEKYPSYDKMTKYVKKLKKQGAENLHKELVSDIVPFPIIEEGNIWWEAYEFGYEEWVDKNLISIANKNKGNFNEYLKQIS